MNSRTVNGMKCFLYLSALLAFTLPAQGASFDCGKAQTKVEHLICDNPEISKLDDELSAAYKTALQDEKQSDSIKQAQKQWMKERNGCSEAACVKQAYIARISTLGSSALAGQVTKEQPFTLTKGKGVAVCEAYLVRLNSTEWGYYEKLPTCGRPENDSVDGFTKLNRVPLTAEQISALYGGVSNFLQGGHSDQGNSKPSDPSHIKPVQQSMNDNGLAVWRYDPPVDIDNDGKPDNDLIVWKGWLNQNTCGRHAGESNMILIHPSYIFSIDQQLLKLNDDRTRELFGHPVGGYPVVVYGKHVMADMFRPIGKEMGIFAYQGQYYFDTFFDNWGDFEGKRKSSDGPPRKGQPPHSLLDILGVFQRKGGVTKQICEYRWNEFEKYYQ